MGTGSRIVIIGGGITGLAAAFAARANVRDTGREASVSVLEASLRFGGNLITEHVDGYVLDGGADSWVASKPHASALARELGLDDVLVGTNPSARRYFIAWKGRLHSVPEGFLLGVPTTLSALARCGLFSWSGKLRMALEPFVPARHIQNDAEADESIGSFVTRRLGREAAERLVGPLLGGISSGDANDLSVLATFPQLVAFEREYGSIVRGMRALRRARANAPATPARGGDSPFVSLESGIHALVSALEARLRAEGVALRLGASVQRLHRLASGFGLELANGDRVEADGVVLALPANGAARLLAGLDGAALASDALGRVHYGSTVTVFLAYSQEALPRSLEGAGFIVPRAARSPLLASTWVSSKWVGRARRAPEGYALVRGFLGGAWGEDLVDRDDAHLVQVARHELGPLMEIATPPLWSRVFRFKNGSAQTRVGHLAMMRGVHDQLRLAAPTLRVAGGGYDGAGISDCIRQGYAAALAVLDAVRNPSPYPR